MICDQTWSRILAEVRKKRMYLHIAHDGRVSLRAYPYQYRVKMGWVR